MADSKYVTVFSQKLAGWLMLNGFVLGQMRPDNEGSGRNIFFFKNSPEIRRKMYEYRQVHPEDKH